jgi:hypothetical protein
VTVRSASAGGKTVKSVHSENAEDKIGKCSFDMYLTSDLDSKIAELKENIGANSIKAFQRLPDGSSSPVSYDNMSLVNDVDREASADGTTTFEFEGDPMAIQ